MYVCNIYIYIYIYATITRGSDPKIPRLRTTREAWIYIYIYIYICNHNYHYYYYYYHYYYYYKYESEARRFEARSSDPRVSAHDVSNSLFSLRYFFI